MKKLKNIILLGIIIISTVTKVNAQQEPSPEIKTYILDKLQNGDYYKRSAVIGSATYMYNIPEVVPILEQTILEQGRTLANDYLVALDIYNSPNFTSLAHWFINSVDTLKVENSSFESALEMKVDITQRLMKRGDFTTVEYVFDLIENKKPNTFISAANILDEIISNLPQFEEEAKSELMRLASLNNENESYNAVYSLTKYYGSEAIPILVSVFVNSSYRPVKALALENLIKYEYSSLEVLLRNHLIPESSMTTAIAERLLELYPTPQNYNFVINNIDQISSNRKLTISFLIEGFTPTPQDTSLTCIDLLDNLIVLIDTVFNYTWVGDLQFKDELKSILQFSKTDLQAKDSLASREDVEVFQETVDIVFADSLNTDPRFVTIDGWKFLYWNAQYILDRLPEPAAGLPVKLQDSQSNLLQGGSLQYYEGSWKDAANNGDGTFNVITERTTVSIRMTYEGGNQQFNNVPVGPDTVTFQTVNTTVQLLNSQNSLIDEGTVQFYAGSWREFGSIVNGTASKELLPRQYSFRMTYGGGNNDKQQNIGTDPVVVFQTVNATVQLLDSQGTLISETGNVQYYAGSWKEFGTTSNGTVSKELLPKQYSFRMTHEGVNNDKQQDIGVEDTVSFSTVLCVVQVKDAQDQPIDGAEVKYYSGSWRDIGLTANGEVSKELLPKNLSFRVMHNGVVQNKQQDIGANNTVEFVVE